MARLIVKLLIFMFDAVLDTEKIAMLKLINHVVNFYRMDPASHGFVVKMDDLYAIFLKMEKHYMNVLNEGREFQVCISI